MIIYEDCDDHGDAVCEGDYRDYGSGHNDNLHAADAGASDAPHDMMADMNIVVL
jgi:hypothetical protein